MGRIGPLVLAAGAIYLVAVGASMYISQSSTNSPTADQIAAWPSLGNAAFNLGAGAALLLFHKQIASKLA